MIRIPQVRVIDEEGNQLGVMATRRCPPAGAGARLRPRRGCADGLAARDAAFSTSASTSTSWPSARRRRSGSQRSVEFKEVRLKPKIGQGDFDTKVRRAIEFLEDGDRIKVAVQFRGRELTHPQLGRDLLAKFADQVKDHGALERAPLLEGKSMHITIASTHKPKPREADRRGEPPRTATPKAGRGGRVPPRRPRSTQRAPRPPTSGRVRPACRR